MKHFYLKEVSRTRRKFALISLILPMFGKEKGATQKIFLEFGLFFFYRNNNRQQPENCNRLLFFL